VDVLEDPGLFKRGRGWFQVTNPMIWRSPIWMPFAWQVVSVQFGYLGPAPLSSG